MMLLKKVRSGEKQYEWFFKKIPRVGQQVRKKKKRAGNSYKLQKCNGSSMKTKGFSDKQTQIEVATRGGRKEEEPLDHCHP